MYRLGKKFAAVILAATVAVSTLTSAFAANSPISGNTTSESKVSATTVSDTSVKVTDATSTTKTLTIGNTVTSGGKTYTVGVIASNTIKAKYNKVAITMNSDTKVEAGVAKSKAAKKTKKFVISAASGQKLTAKQFNKKSFKNCKGKIIVKKSAMTKKQFNKLVKRLKKGGFKGKIKRK